MKKDINIHIKEIWHNNIDEDIELLEAFCDAELPDDLTELLSSEAPPPGTPQVEFTTCGTYEESTEGISITYEESELTGMKGSITSFFISKSGCITMLRTGKNAVNLTFESGKNYICHNGNEPFLVTTRNLKNSISENGGSLDISYTINVDGVMTEHNEFNIDLAPPAFPLFVAPCGEERR